jgi:hypothetical protein
VEGGAGAPVTVGSLPVIEGRSDDLAERLEGIRQTAATRRYGTPGGHAAPVVPIVAVVGATVPFGEVTAHDVTVIPVQRLPGLLRNLPPTLTPERARGVAAQIERRLDIYTSG